MDELSNNKNFPLIYKYYNAYPYGRRKSDNKDEVEFASEMFKFKDTGIASEKVACGFVNRAKKAVVDLGTNKDTIFINMPSTNGADATAQRWSMINAILKDNHINVLDPSALAYTKPKAPAHAVNANGKRDMEYDVLDGLSINCKDQIKGKNVVLLDDVMTTGRHLYFIGDALTKLGAKSVAEVALCSTPPKEHHDDTRYRYGVFQDDDSFKHSTSFTRVLDPKQYQAEFYNIDLQERQLNLFQHTPEAEKQEPKITPISDLYKQKTYESFAAENLSLTDSDIPVKYTKLNPNNNIINSNNSKKMAQENPEQPEKQAEKTEKTMVLPKEVKLGYVNISPIKRQDGSEVKTNEPRFSTTIRLGDLANMQKEFGKLEGNHKTLDLAIVPNKKFEEGKNNSPYVLIAKRDGAPSQYHGKDVNFVDKDAVMEFKLFSAQLLAKASNDLGKKLDDTVQLRIGKTGAGSTGVTFNPAEYPTIDKKNLEIIAQHLNTVNSFDRTIKSQQNMDKIGENRYVDKYVGSAYGYDVKGADKQPVLNEKTQEPIKAFNITLKASDMKFLPEADKFGNVNIAIVKRDMSPEKLAQKGLHMEEGSNYPVNDKGIKQPNYMVLADPKTYKNGEPNEHTVAVIKINKAELNALPKTQEHFTTKDGKEVNNEYIHISTDRFANVKLNTKDYEMHNVVANDTKLTARITPYNTEVNKKEREKWEEKNPRLSEADFTAKVEKEKNMPTQYDAYREAVQNTQKQSQKTEQTNAPKQYKDYSQSNDQEQTKGKQKSMPF